MLFLLHKIDALEKAHRTDTFVTHQLIDLTFPTLKRSADHNYFPTTSYGEQLYFCDVLHISPCWHSNGFPKSKIYILLTKSRLCTAAIETKIFIKAQKEQWLDK